MKTLNLQQGTNAWHEARAKYRTASEAPAMMGVSKYKSRSDLVKEKATGITPEITPQKQALFDRGHASEAASRPFAERIIGEELFPETGVDDRDYLLASFDGITMLHGVCWEHKLASTERMDLAAKNELREDDMIQVQQQLLVSGAEKCLFMVSDGTEDFMETVWVEPDEKLQAKIIAGWAQFDKDVEGYVHTESAAELVGKTPETLPSLRIEVAGQVTASNLDEYKTAALSMFDSINKDLKTDQDFADAEKTVKWCKDIESKLDAAKAHALSQTASIDELFNALDDIKATARDTRLNLDKLVKARKDAVRDEIRTEAVAKYREHIATICASLDGIVFPDPGIDVAGAMKGKKTVSSLQDAADTALANAKINASAVADKIRENLAVIDEFGKDHLFLFSDKQNLVTSMDSEALTEVVKARVISHEASEAAKKVEPEAAAEKSSEATTSPKSDKPEDPKPKVAEWPKSRPSDAEIVEALALHFRAHESKVIEWLLDMDLEAESNKLAANL